MLLLAVKKMPLEYSYMEKNPKEWQRENAVALLLSSVNSRKWGNTQCHLLSPDVMFALVRVWYKSWWSCIDAHSGHDCQGNGGDQSDSFIKTCQPITEFSLLHSTSISRRTEQRSSLLNQLEHPVAVLRFHWTLLNNSCIKKKGRGGFQIQATVTDTKRPMLMIYTDITLRI